MSAPPPDERDDAGPPGVSDEPAAATPAPATGRRKGTTTPADAPAEESAGDPSAAADPAAADPAAAAADRPAGDDPAGDDSAADDPVARAETPAVALTPPVRRPVRAWELALVVALVSLVYLPKLGSYSLWDPWEGHYAEVARRMLEERDWLKMRWQAENFHSKPPLTFWMMALGMKLFGVGADGGFSGEFLTSTRAEWGLRLPFALFGIFGVSILWYALARLVNRRAAWLAALILTTCPYYFFISRQAITDMPSAAMLIGSLALFALAIHDEPDRPLRRFRGLSSYHAFLAAFALVVLGQLVYFVAKLGPTKLPIAPRTFIPGRLVMVPFFIAFAVTVGWTWLRTRSERQVTMYWFYLLSGLAVLQKGPVAPGLAGLTILCYLTLTGEWRLLRRVELARGILIAVVVSLPWHFAIYLKDGNPWLHEYLGTHLLNRALRGAHGDRGTFGYFTDQLAIGMWPWIAFVPVALAASVLVRRPRDSAEKVRFLFALWAIVGVLFFSAIQTKFHHYILPAVPALAALVAFWLDDLLAGRARGVGVAVLITWVLVALASLDLVPAQQKLVQLFIYRYDRTIPRQAPFSIDYTGTLLLFALLVAVVVPFLAWRRARRIAVGALAAATVAFTLFALDVLMIKASPHYGQRAQHELYYKLREIHGVELIYGGLREVLADWGSGRDLEVKTYIPDTLQVGEPMRVRYEAAGQKGELAGTVARIGEHRFWIHVPEAERAKLAPLLAEARASQDPPRRRWLIVDADRLISRLYWRGESFYSTGEVWNPRIPDRQMVFHELNDADNKKFREFLKRHEGKGWKFFVVTEKGKVATTKNLLTTDLARRTYKAEDDLSSFFGLASFTL